jgi:hypothetical protein
MKLILTLFPELYDITAIQTFKLLLTITIIWLHIASTNPSSQQQFVWPRKQSAGFLAVINYSGGITPAGD